MVTQVEPHRQFGERTMDLGARAAAQAVATLRESHARATGLAQTLARMLNVPFAMADATAADGASCFVNPLTALGMVETMKREGHKALVHTAAASNLGQMLLRICQHDGVPLVNIVRKPEQVALLRGLGATHVCDVSSPTFATVRSSSPVSPPNASR